MSDLLFRWNERVHIHPSGCWIWTGRHSGRGYGALRLRGRNGPTRMAHAIGYELLVGPVPAGLELDHLCRNHACVNPAHLEPVTHRENVRRGLAGQVMRDKTHCKQGHEFTLENTSYSGPESNRRRHCRECARAAGRRYHHSHTEKRAAYMRGYYQQRVNNLRID